uniref:Large ribosomal subunit protein uL13c n=1 Tax=Hydropuntia rangiferina TaxID=338881 RepID=A0A345U8J8_9FLOR|nr:ribosomal protein L13 [Hydropuntia rangiferina]AXI96784.1 ribosomal protein L13 [Hydropuntia rangiferina]UAD87465.1 ribosomal protein L13 [Hydropuntia rangiferina]
MNKTYVIKQQRCSQWYIIDAKNKNLGRLSSKVANLLKGKNSKLYTPYINHKIYIVLINSKLINVTGKKTFNKNYKKHSGYPGGLKTQTFNDILSQKPNMILEKAIKGMLPKGILGRQLFRQLKIYPNNNHPHASQKPQIISVI